ncbi:MAG TPA: murein biosynthesis integral membrane protein MurJ [bacterium]
MTSPASGAPSEASSGLIRSTGVITLATGCSRILGFIRDLLIARLFGTALQAQAFVVAFRLPNMLRELVAEGAVTSAFVPVLSRYRAQGRLDEFWAVGQALLAQLLIVLCVIGAAGVVWAPQIVRVIAPGFADDPEKFALTVRLTRLLFPLIVLVGLWAYFMGVLNSLRHFAVPALGPAILNVAMIAALIWWVPGTEPGSVAPHALRAGLPSPTPLHGVPGSVALAVGILIGGVIQVLVQLPVAAKLGFRFRLRLRHPGTGDMLRLLGPRTVAAAVYQVNILVHTALASWEAAVGAGAVAALYFANRLVQLPLALFGTASAQASLPSLAEQAARGDWEGFRTTLLRVIRMAAFLIVPAAAALIALGGPIIRGLFERGAFDAHSTAMTVSALAWYAVGLPAYAVAKAMTGAYYAMHDTRTPLRLAAEAVGVNILLSLGLMWPMAIGGLALASSLANVLNAYRLSREMERRLRAPLLPGLAASMSRMAAAAALMAAGCWGLWSAAGFDAHPWLGLAAVIPAGAGMYALGCRAAGVSELTSLLRWLRRRPA